MNLAGCLFLVACISASAQNLGKPPDRSINPVNIYSAFKLPPLDDGDGAPALLSVSNLQAWNRVKRLGLSSQSPIDAWKAAQQLLTESRGPATRPHSPPSQIAAFNGSTASALNQLIARTEITQVEVISQKLLVDQPIEIRRGGIVVDLGAAQLTSGNPQPYMLRIENVSDVTLLRGNFAQGNSAILVNGAHGVVINGVRIADLTGAGIVVTGSSHVDINGNQISGVPLAGIMIHRGTSQSIVEHNEVTGDTGASNMTAGVVLTDREVDVATNPRAIFGPDGYWVIAQPLSQRLNPPRDNVIAWNHVARNVASGVYVDGGVRNVIYSNLIESNAKEGLCLDNGSAANVVAANTLQENGDRWGQVDSALSLDAVLAGGRLEDGAAAAKVPAISLDNAIYNIVFGNTASHNFGGGIKTVRTGYFNAIGLNLLMDNNDGASDNFHFFGIELGAAPGDDPTLDFTASRGNIVFSNVIRGNHYSGVFLAADSDQNTVLDNTILDSTAWALEAAKQMPNKSANNFTTLPSRNMGSGLDPALITTGMPVNDPPM